MSRVCNKCSNSRELIDFYKDKNAKNGIRGVCKFCDKDKAKIWNTKNSQKHTEHEKKYRESNRKQMKNNKANYVKNNPESVKNSALKFNYNITLEEFNLMKSKQGDSCLICKTHEDNLKIHLCVDHCHTTGRIRGILCSKCNSALGFLNDDIEIAKRLIKYLEDNNV